MDKGEHEIPVCDECRAGFYTRRAPEGSRCQQASPQRHEVDVEFVRLLKPFVTSRQKRTWRKSSLVPKHQHFTSNSAASGGSQRQRTPSSTRKFLCLSPRCSQHHPGSRCFQLSKTELSTMILLIVGVHQILSHGWTNTMAHRYLHRWFPN